MEYYKQLKKLYNSTTTEALQNNYKRIVKGNRLTAQTLAELLEVNIQTIYSYSKSKNYNRIDLINILIIAEYLNIDVFEFFI